MEYEYETLEQANADMSRWQVPAVGEKKFGPKAALIKSTVLLPHYEMAKPRTDVALVEAVQPEDFIGKTMTVTVAKDRDDEAPNTGWVSC
jgi:hypothetical protein